MTVFKGNATRNTGKSFQAANRVHEYPESVKPLRVHHECNDGISFVFMSSGTTFARHKNPVSRTHAAATPPEYAEVKTTAKAATKWNQSGCTYTRDAELQLAASARSTRTFFPADLAVSKTASAAFVVFVVPGMNLNALQPQPLSCPDTST